MAATLLLELLHLKDALGLGELKRSLDSFESSCSIGRAVVRHQ